MVSKLINSRHNGACLYSYIGRMMDMKRLFLLGGLLLLLPLGSLCQSAQLADSLFTRGKQYDNSGNNKQAEFYYREAYRMYRQVQDTAGWLKAGKEYASALMYSSKNPQAMKLYHRLLKVQHPANNAYNRADIYNSMGLCSKKTGHLDHAMKYYQQSMPLAEESGDSLLIGVVYDNIGGVYQSMGQLEKSLEFRRKALPYIKASGKPSNLARTLGSIGSIYETYSLYDKALEYYNRSLKIRKKLRNVNLLSNGYNAIGGIQQEFGNYDQALVAYKKSLDYSLQAGFPKSTATILNNIGLLYKHLGEYDKALDYYRQSLTTKKNSGPQSVATTTNNIGKLFWTQGKYDEAAPFYHKALELRKKVGNPYDIASSLSSLAQLEFERGHYEQSEQYADSIETIGDSTGSYQILGDAYTWEGHVEEARGNHTQALRQFQKAYAYSQYLPPEDRLDQLKNLASEYKKMDSDSAIYYGQKAVNIIEQTRANAGALSELKSGYFQRHSDFYTQLASWVLNYHQNTSRAFHLAEQAKARSFTDELAKASKNIDQKLPDEARIKRHEKTKHIDDLYDRLEKTKDADKQAAIKNKIRSAELDYAAYENSLQDKYPQLKSFKAPKSITLEEARQMTDDQTAVLEYALAGNELIMFLISQDKVRVQQFSLSGDRPLDSKLTSWVSDFKDAILSEAPKPELKVKSQKLYNALLKPFEDDLTSFSKLIIVPAGALAYLPFEALYHDGQYLIQRYQIKYEPSLTSLKMLKEHDERHPKDLLAVAGSNVSGENFGGSVKNHSLAALPSTIMEVDSIASHFKRVSLLEKNKVSESAFKDSVRNNSYKYIHLATHGIIDESDPRRSGLALSAQGKITASSKDDGLLRSSEIFGLHINSDMVVLSACNTGLGKVVRGEGMLGMQRSFFYAGTSTVVVSLWSVYDRSTAYLMNEFYKNLLNDQSQVDWSDTLLRWIGWDTSVPFGRKAEAMRQAKLKMIHSPLFNHPIYWAPFIVVGR